MSSFRTKSLVSTSLLISVVVASCGRGPALIQKARQAAAASTAQVQSAPENGNQVTIDFERIVSEVLRRLGDLRGADGHTPTEAELSPLIQRLIEEALRAHPNNQQAQLDTDEVVRRFVERVMTDDALADRLRPAVDMDDLTRRAVTELVNRIRNDRSLQDLLRGPQGDPGINATPEAIDDVLRQEQVVNRIAEQVLRNPRVAEHIQSLVRDGGHFTFNLDQYMDDIYTRVRDRLLADNDFINRLAELLSSRIHPMTPDQIREIVRNDPDRRREALRDAVVRVIDRCELAEPRTATARFIAANTPENVLDGYRSSNEQTGPFGTLPYQVRSVPTSTAHLNTPWLDLLPVGLSNLPRVTSGHSLTPAQQAIPPHVENAVTLLRAVFTGADALPQRSELCLGDQVVPNADAEAPASARTVQQCTFSVDVSLQLAVYKLPNHVQTRDDTETVCWHEGHRCSGTPLASRYLPLESRIRTITTPAELASFSSDGRFARVNNIFGNYVYNSMRTGTAATSSPIREGTFNSNMSELFGLATDAQHRQQVQPENRISSEDLVDAIYGSNQGPDGTRAVTLTVADDTWVRSGEVRIHYFASRRNECDNMGALQRLAVIQVPPAASTPSTGSGNASPAVVAPRATTGAGSTGAAAPQTAPAAAAQGAATPTNNASSGDFVSP